MTSSRALALVACAGLACDVSTPRRFVVGQPACPVLVSAPARVSVDTRCTPRTCRARIAQDGCRVALETDGCGIGRIGGSLDPAGALTFEPSVLGRCVEIPRPPEALFAAECRQTTDVCSFAVYPELPPRFDVRVLPLSSQPPAHPHHEPRAPVDGFSAYAGYLGGAALSGDELAVVVYDELAFESDCRGRGRGRIHFVDLRREVTVRTASAPACLTVLAADPAGTGYVGVFGEPPRLGRFDPGTGLVAERPLDGLAPRPLAFPISLLPNEGELLLTLAHGQVFAVRPGDLSVRVHQEPPVASTRSAGLGDGQLILSDSTMEQYHFHDRRSLARVKTVSLPDSVYDNDPGPMVAHVQSGALVFGATGATPSTGIIKDGIIAYTAPFEAAAAPWAVLPWPEDQGLLLVGLTDNSSAALARVALYDPLLPSYRPGSQLIGVGAVRDLVEHQGVVWAVLPWQGALARISGR